jgi:hypothetical protein
MDSDQSSKKTSRRRFLQSGAVVVVAQAASGTSALAAEESPKAAAPKVAAPRSGHGAGRMPKAPNIVVIMTDQERHHTHWPAGWTEKNMPGLQRLKRNGLYFTRAYTAVTQCSPSRAAMMVGRFAPVNRVTRTFLWPGLVHKNLQPNIASLLKEKAGYEVVWKGKWHLSYAANAAPGNGGEDWTAADIKVMEANYGWTGWNPPDAGNAIEEVQPTEFGKFDGLATLGGADPDNDGRYIWGGSKLGRHGQTAGFGEGVVDFLRIGRPSFKSRSASSYRWSIRTTCIPIPALGRRQATSAMPLPDWVSSCHPITTMTCRKSRSSRKPIATASTSFLPSMPRNRIATTSTSTRISTSSPMGTS